MCDSFKFSDFLELNIDTKYSSMDRNPRKILIKKSHIISIEERNDHYCRINLNLNNEKDNTKEHYFVAHSFAELIEMMKKNY